MSPRGPLAPCSHGPEGETTTDGTGDTVKTRLLAPAWATLITLLPLAAPTTAHAATRRPKNDICGWSRPDLKGKRSRRTPPGATAVTR